MRPRGNTEMTFTALLFPEVSTLTGNNRDHVCICCRGRDATYGNEVRLETFVNHFTGIRLDQPPHMREGAAVP